MRPPAWAALAVGAALLAATTWGLLAHSRGRSPLGFFTPARLAAELEGMLGVPVEVARVRFDPLVPGLVIENLRVAIQSWTLEVPQLRVRPDLESLLRGDFELLAAARSFALQVHAGDGAQAVERIPELLDVIGLPEARVRLAGGAVRTNRGSTLLTELRFELDPTPEGATLSARARQSDRGRLDVHGSIGRSRTLELDAYLDDLSTPDAERWIRLIADPRRAGIATPRLRAAASGRWHVRIGPDGERSHEFALQLKAAEAVRESPQLLGTQLRVAGRISLAPDHAGSGGASHIVPGGRVRLAGRAERLRLWSLEAGPHASPLLLSGPFEIDLLPFGAARDPSFVAEADFGATHLSLPGGVRKRAGTRARVGVARGAGPGEPAHIRFSLEVGSLVARGEIGSDAGLVARSEWVSLPALAELVPELAPLVAGGRARIAQLRSRGLPRFEARLDLAEVRLAGDKLPLPLESLSGAVRVTEESFAARDVVATIGKVPIRADVRGDRVRVDGEERLRVRFRVDAEKVVVHRAPTGSVPESPFRDTVGLPPILRRLAEDSLASLHDVGLGEALEIEEGVLRCSELTAPGESIHDLEVALALRNLRLELPRIAFQLHGQRRSYAGSIDLNPLLPDVRIAALE